MTVQALVEQLTAWGGDAHVWQVRAAFDYPHDFDATLRRAAHLGHVELSYRARQFEEGDVRLVRGRPR